MDDAPRVVTSEGFVSAYLARVTVKVSLLRWLITTGVVLLGGGQLPAAGQVPTAPEHVIGVRIADDRAELYSRRTNARFVVRGTNYILLEQLHKPDGSELLYHSTFNTGLYQGTRVRADLGKMGADGYNVVRVFLNAATEGGIPGTGPDLSPSYLENLADFLVSAKENRLSVILTLDWIPIPVPSAPPSPVWCADYQCSSVQVLTQDGIRANQLFFRHLVGGLLSRNAPTDVILAYELRNEATFDSDLPPLSLSSGMVTTANGKTYDLSSAEQKDRMLEEGLAYWIDKVRESILELDPTALISVGFVPPKGPNPTRVGEKRTSVVGGVIRSSKLDIVDIHVYPEGGGPTMEQLAENFGVVGFRAKPVIMGEFGALTTQYPSREAALRKMLELQASSCELGIGGWVYWAWHVDHNADTYNLLDDNEYLNNVMAPVNHPDPCSSATAVRFRKNIAVGAIAKASQTYGDFSPDCAIDGTTRPWNSGGVAPQWIELDLQEPDSVETIRLVVSQQPAGETIHQIWVRSQNEDYRLLKELRSRTEDRGVIEVASLGLANIQFIKIVTLQSPSWVGWREVEVLRPSAR
jgi:hypothetical protein